VKVGYFKRSKQLALGGSMKKTLVACIVGLFSTFAYSAPKQMTVSEPNFYPKNYDSIVRNLQWYLLNEIDKECPNSETVTVENPKMNISSYDPLSGRPLMGTIRRTEQGFASIWFPQSYVSMTVTVDCN